MSEARVAGAVPIAGFYFLYFSSVGVLLPFAPAYLKSLSFSGTEVGLLLALTPLTALLAPPFWGLLADRTGRPDGVLRVIGLGALAGFLPLLAARSFGAVALCLGAYGVFASSVTPVIDSLALQRVAQTGGNYAHLRLFGSVGFVITAAAFGLGVEKVDRSTVLAAGTAIAIYAAWSLTLRAKVARGAVAPPSPLAAIGLLKDRPLALLLAGTCLHWVASAPYNSVFSIHVLALGLRPSVVGLSAALGVLAEVGVMLVYPKLAHRISPPALLTLAFAVSVLRWAGMAVVTSPGAILALTSLHSMTFGAFYLASVAFVAQRAPQRLRASGMALFASVTFGVGGLIGYVSAGSAYDWLGGHGLFAAAAVAELAATGLVAALWWSSRARPMPEPA